MSADNMEYKAKKGNYEIDKTIMEFIKKYPNYEIELINLTIELTPKFYEERKKMFIRSFGVDNPIV